MTESHAALGARARRIVERFRFDGSERFRIKEVDPGDTAGLDLEKDEAAELLADGVAALAEKQDILYAQDRWSVLLLFQAMDAAGKDGTIKHVMSGVNPQGVHVTSFKTPNATELDHDFLWRHAIHLPERGRIGVHNRSWYEEVLIARVHPEILGLQKVPASLAGKRIYDERLEDIAAFERYLARQGTVILKFFLHVSKKEQKRRFLERIDNSDKNWKFNLGDVEERTHWSDYMDAYEAAIRATAAPHAPWFVVPADAKWFTRLVVCAAVVQALNGLDLAYPSIDEAAKRQLEQAREALSQPSRAR